MADHVLGVNGNPAWAAANKVSPGALVVAGYGDLHTFGSVCVIVFSIGIVSNNIPGIYSAGLNWQCLGSWLHKVPRMVWNLFSVVICTVTALAGQNHLYDIFQNFLSLMGYWVLIWVVITIQESLIFRRGKYNWEDWNTQSRLPIGLAALTAFCVGWVGAILGMDQVWFIGPLADLVGDQGSNIGMFIGPAWGAICFPPLRWMELRYLGR